MFWTFFWFEIKLRFRSVSTYIFFLIPFGMLFFSVSTADFGPVPAGKILLNGPWALMQNYGQITGFGSILIAAIFGVCASLGGEAAGIWGASRHALTVGFIAAMVFCVGQRVLPSFCGMRILWSPGLMLWMLTLLMTGCTVRVASEILAYQGYAAWAWSCLPLSALMELAAVLLFAVNLLVTFLRPPIVMTTPLNMTIE